jgi:hypothetical protein
VPLKGFTKEEETCVLQCLCSDDGKIVKLNGEMEFQEDVTLIDGSQRIIKKETDSKIILALYMCRIYAQCRK